MTLYNQIYYFLIGEYNKKSEIGHYLIEGNSISEEDKNYIVSEAEKKYKNFSEKDVGSKEYTVLSNSNYCLFYYITSAGTFYLSVASIHSVYTDKNNLMYELFEDIEHQGIKKLMDESGVLTRVGVQNLKFSIEKNNNKMKELNGEDGENRDNNKILLINEELSSIHNDMKNSVKNMIVNVNEMNDLDSKSSEIKDVSYKFQQESAEVERKMRNRNRMMKIGFGIFVIISIYIALKVIFL